MQQYCEADLLLLLEVSWGSIMSAINNNHYEDYNSL